MLAFLERGSYSDESQLSRKASRPVADVSVLGPADGDVIQLGPTRVRILEDGSATQHRIGIGELTLAPHSTVPATDFA
jgi:hypothetical protein